MFSRIFKNLDQWVIEQNKIADDQGFLSYNRCDFYLLGQNALIEAKLDLELTATADVDVYTDASNAVKVQLNEILKNYGLSLDPLGEEIWMPKETQYVRIYRGRYVSAFRARPEYVFLSKAFKAPDKNKVLLRQYIADKPPKKFFDLCQKYKINVQIFLED